MDARWNTDLAVVSRVGEGVGEVVRVADVGCVADEVVEERRPGRVVRWYV
jgi:hypothetical protein